MRLILTFLSLSLMVMHFCTQEKPEEKQQNKTEIGLESINPHPSPEVQEMCIRSACALPSVPGLGKTTKMKFNLLQVPFCAKTPKNNPLSNILENKNIKDSLKWIQLQSLSQSWSHKARLIQTQQDLYHSQLCALEVIRVHLEQVALSDYKLFLGSQKKKPSP